MKKKFILEVSETEMKDLILSLRGNNETDKLGSRLFKQLFTDSDFKIKKSVTFSFDKDLVGNAQMMQAIIHCISLSTGTDESTITPESKLWGVGVTPTKKAEIRSAVNRYLEQQASTKTISSAEMNSATTVQDIYNIAEHKL